MLFGRIKNLRQLLFCATTVFTACFSQQSFPSPAEEPPDNEISFLESARNLFADRVNLAANQLDSFFATERADDELGRSFIRLRSQYFLRDGEKSDFENQYRINLKLPSLEKKFRYDFDKDKKKKNKDNTNKENKSDPDNPSGFFNGWTFNSDIGVVAAIPPKLVTRARLRKNFNTGAFIHRFAEQLTHITDESGLIEETELDSDHVIKSNLIFRFVNYKRWQVLKKDVSTNHGPTLLHRFSENDAFNYGLTTQTILNNGTWYLSNYRAAINYRRNLYRQWVYFDVIPGVDFPKERSWRKTPFITFQLEVLFGGT